MKKMFMIGSALVFSISLFVVSQTEASIFNKIKDFGKLLINKKINVFVDESLADKIKKGTLFEYQYHKNNANLFIKEMNLSLDDELYQVPEDIKHLVSLEQTLRSQKQELKSADKNIVNEYFQGVINGDIKALRSTVKYMEKTWKFHGDDKTSIDKQNLLNHPAGGDYKQLVGDHLRKQIGYDLLVAYIPALWNYHNTDRFYNFLCRNRDLTSKKDEMKFTFGGENEVRVEVGLHELVNPATDIDKKA